MNRSFADRPDRLVVVTRVGPLASSLVAELDALGLPVVHAPMFALDPIDERALADEFDRGAPFERVVVTSPRAAEVALRSIGARRLRDTLCIAPGAGTAAPLREAGVPVVHPESGGTSEDVLALPALAVARIEGRSILILAAEGGRTRIAETLADRGADVRVLAPYRRAPLAPPSALLDALAAGCVPITLVSSPATLRRLAEALAEPHRSAWVAGPFIVSSPRLAEQARALGVEDVTISDGAADPAMLDAFRRRMGAATPQ